MNEGFGTLGSGDKGTADGITGLFKIANGEDIAKAPAPGTFDLKARSPPSHHNPSHATQPPKKLKQSGDRIKYARDNME